MILGCEGDQMTGCCFGDALVTRCARCGDTHHCRMYTDAEIAISVRNLGV